MRGVVRFTAGGVEHALQFTINRLCDLEEASGKTVTQYAALLGKPGAAGVRDVRALMQFGLGCGVEEAGNIVEELGLKAALQLVAKALAEAFGNAPEGKPAAGKRSAGAA